VQLLPQHLLALLSVPLCSSGVLRGACAPYLQASGFACTYLGW
jgi:hypothetical protein